MDWPCILNGLGIRIDTLASVSGQESMRVGGHTTHTEERFLRWGRGSNLSTGTRLSIFELGVQLPESSEGTTSISY